MLDEVERYLEARFGEAFADQTTLDPLPRDRRQSAVPRLVGRSPGAQGLHHRRSATWHRAIPDDALEATIPASFAAAVAREFEELAPDERLAIASASVLGIEFSLWLAAQASAVDELALEPVLEDLARRQRFIVREGVIELANGMFSPLYRFRHSLYQEIVLERTDAQIAGAGARARGARDRAAVHRAARPTSPAISPGTFMAPAITGARPATSGSPPPTP